jgi:hypothetical protein
MMRNFLLAIAVSTICFFVLFSNVAKADETQDALLALAKDHSDPKATLSKIIESGNPKIMVPWG